RRSAGATIRLGYGGTGRFGSRKKAIVKRKSARKTSDSHADTNKTAPPPQAKIKRIHRASKRVCERIRDGIFRVQNRMVKQREKSCRNRSSQFWCMDTIS